jgi:hypothetical protein
MSEQNNWTNWLMWGIPVSGLILFVVNRIAARSDRIRAYDRETLVRIQEDLSGVIAYMRQRDFGGVFSNHIFEQFDSFLVKSLEPEYKFTGRKLEAKRKQLDKALESFAVHLAINSSPLENPNISRIFPNGFENREKFTELKDRLNAMGDETCRLYDELVAIAKG